MTHNCRVCSVELNNNNWSPARQKNSQYICKECNTEKGRLYRKNNPEKAKAYSTKGHRKEGHMQMSENTDCPIYLGIHIVEHAMKHIFNDVEVMPMNNPGYDFVYDGGKKVDAKSGCILNNRNNWQFHINHNTTTDYFVCVAFDNRKDLNPLHIWMLPGDKFNHLSTASISISTIHKWDVYRLDIDDVIMYCNTIRNYKDI